MANHKSAEKRARQALKRQARNSAVKKSLKTLEKKLLKAAQNKAPETLDLVKNFSKKIMQAVAKGVLKKETMSRKLSRTQVKVNQFLKT